MITQLVGNLLVRHRVARAIVPEADAVALAEKNEYHVIGTNLRRDLKVLVDGSPVRVEIPAELLVTKDGKNYIGQAGSADADPGKSDLRQALLEWRYAYGVDGMIRLQSGDEEKIQRIDFVEPFRTPGWAWLVIGGIVGAMIENRYHPATFFLGLCRQYFMS